jgi:hypothetical protein
MIVRLTPDECTWLGDQFDGKAESEQNRILEVIGTSSLSPQEIVSKTGIPYSTLMRRLEAMLKQGVLNSRTIPGRGSPQEWFRTITEAQKPLADVFGTTAAQEEGDSNGK